MLLCAFYVVHDTEQWHQRECYFGADAVEAQSSQRHHEA